jgi:hypothetical protein
MIAAGRGESLRVTVEDVARWRGVGVNRVREDVRTGKQPGVVREGRRLLFDRAVVLRSLGLADAPTAPATGDDVLRRALRAGLHAALAVLDESHPP